MVYAVILFVAYLFDSTNNIFELSLLKIVSFGALTFCEDEESSYKRGYMTMGKMLKVSTLCIVVGLFIVSGGVFSWLLKIYSLIRGVVG